MLAPYNEVSKPDISWLNSIIFDDYEFPSEHIVREIKNLDSRLADEIGWYYLIDDKPVSQVS